MRAFCIISFIIYLLCFESNAQQRSLAFEQIPTSQTYNSAMNGKTGAEEEISTVEKINDSDWQRISNKMKRLPSLNHLALKQSEKDWLIDASDYKAEVYAGEDGKTLIISNGLTARVFRVTPNLATIDIINQMDGNSMLRAVSGEGELTIDGTVWHLGGLDGQPERGYLKEEWIDNMSVKERSFMVKDFEIRDTIATLQWARKRWALNKENPTGKSLVFTLQGVDEVEDLILSFSYPKAPSS